ncbi:unnamed protein product, partial [Trichogramma brassicae]
MDENNFKSVSYIMGKRAFQILITQADGDDATYHAPGSLRVSLRRFGLNRCLEAHDPGLIVRKSVKHTSNRAYSDSSSNSSIAWHDWVLDSERESRRNSPEMVLMKQLSCLDSITHIAVLHAHASNKLSGEEMKCACLGNFSASKKTSARHKRQKIKESYTGRIVQRAGNADQSRYLVDIDIDFLWARSMLTLRCCSLIYLLILPVSTGKLPPCETLKGSRRTIRCAIPPQRGRKPHIDAPHYERGDEHEASS